MEKLLEPIEIAGLRFKNRMIHEPTTLNMSDPHGHVTDKIIGAYESLAAGGSSAVIVGATCVRRDGLINERMLGMYDDTYVIGHRDLVDVIRNNGALAGIQLFYGGMIPGVGTTVDLEPGKGWIPDTIAWGPSDKVVIGHPKPRVTPEEVYDQLVDEFAHAARRCKEAKYDFVSLHFCHGSLPHTNLSLVANVGRTDKYADRFLFCEKIIQRIQEICGKGFPIIPRLCCDENLVGGYDIPYFVEHYAPRLHALGIAALDCTFGSMIDHPSRNPDVNAWENVGPGFYTPNAVNLSNIELLKSMLIEKGMDMPLIGSANLCTPDDLRLMVEPGRAEFAGTCRLSLDDPEYANKIAEGRENEVRKSIRTGASLLQGNLFNKGWAGSAQNPSFGRDLEYRIRPTLRPRKVVVVGGGSGGMEYAITAREIGHEVMLFEKSGRLGGAMAWGGNYKMVPNMNIIRYQPDYHCEMMKKFDVPYRLNVEPTVDQILAEKPDVVVVATGAQWDLPNIDGLSEALDSGFAATLDTAMSRDVDFEPGENPVIFGSAMGCELAIDYAMQGLDVRVIDDRPAHRPVNFLGSRGKRVDEMMKRYGLQVESGIKPIKIEGKTVLCEGPNGAILEITPSKFVICPERQPADSLVSALHGHGVAVQVVGDARTPRSYGNALAEAAYLSRRL